ncbi:MAG: SsrA-binding protein SmpB [Christensenellales bacterium]
MDKTIVTNKKAFHDYFIEQTFEAGIILEGNEVKSLRLGNVNLNDSYAFLAKDGIIYLSGAHISPYSKGSYFNPDPRRDRILLLNKTEIRKIRSKTLQKGYTLVPLKLYFKQGLVKVELGIAKGKELHDKRETLKEKDMKRTIERDTKSY